jgi:hypothetical protein
MPNIEAELRANISQLLSQIDNIRNILKNTYSIETYDKPIEIEFELEDCSGKLSTNSIERILKDVFRDYIISVKPSSKPNFYNVKIVFK